jgi:hypothetical protein
MLMGIGGVLVLINWTYESVDPCEMGRDHLSSSGELSKSLINFANEYG